MASSVQNESKPSFKPPQWTEGPAPTAAAGHLPAALLLALVRAAYKVDEELFDEVFRLPTVAALIKSDKEKEEVSAPPLSTSARRQKQLVALESAAGNLFVC